METFSFLLFLLSNFNVKTNLSDDDQIMTTTTSTPTKSTTTQAINPKTIHDNDSTDEDVELIHKSKSKSITLERNEDLRQSKIAESEAQLQQTLPNLFEGLTFLLFNVDSNHEKEIRKIIITCVHHHSNIGLVLKCIFSWKKI